MSGKSGEGLASLVKRWLISGLGVWLGSYLVDGISYADNATLVIVVLLLGLFNAVLKPILVLFALPFVLLTLGLGLLFINALVYLLVGEMVGGFSVDGFWSAFLGALIISLLNLLFAGWIGGGGGNGMRVRTRMGRSPTTSRPGKPIKPKDDVIDV